MLDWLRLILIDNTTLTC